MRYRAILAAGAARIEPYNPRNDPTVTGYPSIAAAIHALGAYTEPVTHEKKSREFNLARGTLPCIRVIMR